MTRMAMAAGHGTGSSEPVSMPYPKDPTERVRWWLVHGGIKNVTAAQVMERFIRRDTVQMKLSHARDGRAELMADRDDLYDQIKRLLQSIPEDLR